MDWVAKNKLKKLFSYWGVHICPRAWEFELSFSL
jgi:hypothetical protein